LAKEFPYILVTGVRIPEYTHWQMRHIPQLRQLAPDPIAWVHPNTAQDSGIVDGEMIFVETQAGQIKIKASVTEDLRPGVVSLTHGWEAELNANNLIELEPRDSVTGYAEFRNLACRIKRV
jgi:anaerobic selenocysteine-containing dehydrogenase